jgi:hypothetical protein
MCQSLAKRHGSLCVIAPCQEICTLLAHEVVFIVAQYQHADSAFQSFLSDFSLIGFLVDLLL